MGATVFLALAGAIDKGEFDESKRIGIFSYGSGCCSEFYSGVISTKSQETLSQFKLSKHLDERYLLSMEEYENTFEANKGLKFGVKDHIVNAGEFSSLYNKLKGKNKLVLSEIKNYHRIYKWV